jgi:hypothetical protein
MGLTLTGGVAPSSGQDIPKPSKRPDKKQRDKGQLPRIHLEGIRGTDRTDSEQILREASIVHALPERRVQAHPQTYRYLLDRLDIAGQLVKKWRLGRYRITREGGNTFQVDDRRGAVAQLREIQTLRTEKGWSRIYLARGYFKIPMIPGPRIDGKGLILLEYEPDGPNRLKTRAWVLFRIDNKILNHLSKMARKIVKQVIGKKCQLFVLAAAEVSERIAKDPQKAFQALQSLDGVTPQTIQDFQTTILDRK